MIKGILLIILHKYGKFYSIRQIDIFYLYISFNYTL
ncbi:hypothetical protein MCERE19_04222 [Spirosomataceae bacterium]